MKRKIVGIFVMILFIATAGMPLVKTTTMYTTDVNETMKEISDVTSGCSIPNDPNFSQQWPLHNTGQTGGKADADIDAPEAWDIETGDENIVIAIIDSGIDYTHPDLINNIWVNDDEVPNNGVDDDNNGYIDDRMGYNFMDNNVNLKDNYGHGTMVAGIIGAVTNNGIGVAGICWNCKIMPVKLWNVSFYEITVPAFEKAIRYATDNGADVISMSFGGYREDFTETEFIALKDGIDYAYGKGCVLVAAAGNDGKSSPFYPAAFENVLAAAGTNDNDKRMRVGGTQSNYGDWVDIAAPAELIFTTMTTYDSYNTERGFPKDYSPGTGTSYAAPHVAGVAALIKSKNPSYSPEKIMDIIKANVDPYDDSTHYLGTGRLNAYKALTEFNVAPEKPGKPTGKTSGKVGKDYTFTTMTIDTNGDQLYYKWNWGDGNYSIWFGPYDSGVDCQATYNWSQESTYNISVKAKDIYGAESDWSDPLVVSMPKNKIISINPLILQFLENHPHLFPVLRHLLLFLG